MPVKDVAKWTSVLSMVRAEDGGKEERGGKEGGREDAKAPSHNEVSSVTLTTAACASNVLIMNLCQEMS